MPEMAAPAMNGSVDRVQACAGIAQRYVSGWRQSKGLHDGKVNRNDIGQPDLLLALVRFCSHMSSPFRFLAVLIVTAFLLPGCALWPFGQGKRRATEEARLRALRHAPQMIGTVTLVNEDGGFALIDNEGKFSPPLGTIVKTQTADEQSGELRLTDIRKRPFIIADIVKGGPKRGDRVIYTPASAP